MQPRMGGVEIREDPHLVTELHGYSDNRPALACGQRSKSRSAARAARRAKRGHPQRVTWVLPQTTAYSLDGGRTLIMHPAIARKLKEEAEKCRN